jgi:hypothetical protein
MLSVKTKTIRIALAGTSPSPAADYTIAKNANTTAQVFTLTGVIPAKGALVNCLFETEQAFDTGAVAAKLGTSSGGTQIVPTTTITTAGTLAQPDPTPATSVFPLNPIASTATTLYVELTRSAANWSTLSTGLVSLKLTYIDYANVSP